MDYQRILIFMGLAVTGYLLMLAWQEDYGHQATRSAVLLECPKLDRGGRRVRIRGPGPARHRHVPKHELEAPRDNTADVVHAPGRRAAGQLRNRELGGAVYAAPARCVFSLARPLPIKTVLTLVTPVACRLVLD